MWGCVLRVKGGCTQSSCCLLCIVGLPLSALGTLLGSQMTGAYAITHFPGRAGFGSFTLWTTVSGIWHPLDIQAFHGQQLLFTDSVFVSITFEDNSHHLHW